MACRKAGIDFSCSLGCGRKPSNQAGWKFAMQQKHNTCIHVDVRVGGSCSCSIHSLDVTRGKRRVNFLWRMFLIFIFASVFLSPANKFATKRAPALAVERHNGVQRSFYCTIYAARAPPQSDKFWALVISLPVFLHLFASFLLLSQSARSDKVRNSSWQFPWW